MFKRILFGLALVLLVGCGPGALLKSLTVEPASISPRATSPNAVAKIDYALGRDGVVSIYLLDPQNKRFVVRENLERAAGDYEIQFGGVVNDRMLADGQYQVVVEAKDARGDSQSLRQPLTITNADTTLPELQNLTVAPAVFTPNRDGVDDRVTIRYYLTKPAKVRVFLTDAARKNQYPIEERKVTRVTDENGWLVPGSHEYDYDGGIDRDAPPPDDGDYTVVAISQDQVGNVVREERPLKIQDGGVPRATIVGAGVEFAPSVVQLGQPLYFTVTVKNIGTVPIRTKGPEPGTAYTTSENYNSKGDCCYEEPGVWRIGVDFEGNSSGRLYPYRWQLGRTGDLKRVEVRGQVFYYLMPNQAAMITGTIRIVDKPPLVNPHYWIGLVQEQVRIVEDRVGYETITVGY